jgi:hypothetical protein
VTSQVLWRGVHAMLLARAGEFAEAEAVVRGAVELSETADAPEARGNALLDEAEVLTMSGDRDGAAAVLARALEQFERKAMDVPAELTRAKLSALEPTIRS